MIVGIPKEIKEQESRVAAVPAMVHNLVEAGHEVLVETRAGVGAGIPDGDFHEAGAKTVADAGEIWARAGMIVKVKEPLPEEYGLLSAGQILFTYLHLAANQELTDAMVHSGAHCFAYETLTVNRHLPLLTPMSEVAGRMAIQVGAFYLEAHNGGRGILMSGVPGVEPATTVILGGGTVGTNAAKVAAGLGSKVILMDIDLERLRYLSDVMPPNVTLLHSSPLGIRAQLREADLVVGAVLVHGARAPMLLRREDLKIMKSDGPVVVDVSVDQGGCIETCKPTTHADPTYLVDGVLHYCVANMPGAVPRTSTFALTNATGPYVSQLAQLGAREAARHPVLGTAANVLGGVLTHEGVADAFGMDCVSPDQAL